MKNLIITLLVLMSSGSFAGSGKWFLFTSEVNLDKATQCHKAGFTTTPGKRMKHFDQIGIQYKIGDEKDDGSGVVTSLSLTKNPKGDYPETYFYYRTMEACKTAYNKVKAEIDKKSASKKSIENKKYGAYN